VAEREDLRRRCCRFLARHPTAEISGIDHSGMGREGGRQAINNYLNVKLADFGWVEFLGDLGTPSRNLSERLRLGITPIII
jgi:hypothetical protein